MQASNGAEMTEAEGGDLESPGFSPPPEKCQEAMEPSGAKAGNFSNESGDFSETAYFKMLVYVINILGSLKCFSLACILWAGHPLDCGEGCRAAGGPVGWCVPGAIS